MLIPAPGPAYTLAPGIDRLSPGQERALQRSLRAITGRAASVVVTAIRATGSHWVVEMATATGPLLVLEREPVTVA